MSVNIIKRATSLTVVFLSLILYLSTCRADLCATFLDVGATDYILIEADGETMLVDTGRQKTWPHVFDVLTEHNVRKIDYLVATHPHLDHIGAIPELVDAFPIGRVLLPPIEYGTNAYMKMIDAIETSGLYTVYPQPKDSFTLGEAEVVVYGPHPVAYENVNDWSIVLMVKYADRSILLTGDAEAEAEYDMLLYNDILPLEADVLKVAHHGSDTSSTFDFIKAVHPRFAVVSCDSTQNVEYPNVETAMTLFECGVEDVFTTEKCGDVTATIDADGEIAISTKIQAES